MISFYLWVGPDDASFEQAVEEVNGNFSWIKGRSSLRVCDNRLERATTTAIRFLILKEVDVKVIQGFVAFPQLFSTLCLGLYKSKTLVFVCGFVCLIVHCRNKNE